MRNLKDIDIKFVKGIGPRRAEILKKELGISNAYDLLHHFPNHYLDRTSITLIRDFSGEETQPVQVKGRFISFVEHGEGAKRRLVGLFSDGTAAIEIVWFRRIKDILRAYDTDKEYILFGTPKIFNGRWNMPHPEIDPATSIDKLIGYRSVYPLTEKLRHAGITSRSFINWTAYLLETIKELPEILPDEIVSRRHLLSYFDAIREIHFPKTQDALERARMRMKYEELFFLELQILRYSKKRDSTIRGFRFDKVGEFFNSFYRHHLPFSLTEAQKRVMKEIRADMNTGRQMNRLIQGDVGSGKTVVALMAMLLAKDNGYQACIMAPTEILAGQHYSTFRELAAQCGVSIALLTGSTRKKEREDIHIRLINGDLDIIVGTHALLEDVVRFHKLGIAIIDEQHRFGVVQRSRLWRKNQSGLLPHVLVMTATPIPRTLAMTVYGDLDISIIDQLPPGRKPVLTLLRYENQRQQVYRALGTELKKGRQAYIVYPLIEESEKLDLKSLEEGYELIKETFPSYKVAMIHGRMKPAEKDWQMHLFATGQSQILVATTVIEVGVNVPNASVMIIENAERFGLSQLHQLRGRVGRGNDQSYCILMSKIKIARETRQRLEIMTTTTDGFIVAEADLKLRGPGDIEGTLQSGIAFDLKVASLATDGQILQIARDDAQTILDLDPQLRFPENHILAEEIRYRNPNAIDYSLIS